jgi:excisionase family DNA binding protein
MSVTTLTINPEDVRDATRSANTSPVWLARVAEYVERAAAVGETVTLTAKPRLLTPAQVAEALGISRPTVSRRIKAGELRAIKVGNHNRIPYEEFERFWRQMMGDMVELTADDLRDDLFGER